MANLPTLLHPSWRVFPVEANGKKPLVKDWPKVATSNRAQHEAWAREFPHCNWGLATGAASGVFILDVDGKEGEQSILALLKQGNAIPETLTAQTGRGWHLYFSTPHGATITNSRGTLEAGLDIRGEGGFGVIAPSRHESGKLYAFCDPQAPIAPAPQWLLERLARPAPATLPPAMQTPRGEATEHEKAYAAKALRNECEKLAATTTGRNSGLNNAALHMGELVGSGWIDRSDVEAALWDAATQNGYRAKDGDHEAWATLQSGLSAGMKQPRAQLNTVTPDDFTQLVVNTKPQLQSTPAGIAPFSIDDIPSIFTFDNSAIDFVVKDIIACGAITMIAGDAGSGKSTFITRMANAIANGKPFLGRSTTQRKVLYLDRENSLPIVRERLERLQIEDDSNFKYFGQWTHHDVLAPGSPLITQWVEANTPRPIVFVDSFIAFLDGNENSSEYVRPFFAKLNNLKQLGCAIVILHHTGKGETTKEFRGSSDIKAAIDVGYTLANRGGTRLEHLALTAFKTRLAVADSIAMEYRDGELWTEDSKQQTESVLNQLLFDNSGITKTHFEELAKPCGTSRSSIRRFIDQGIAKGTIIVNAGVGRAQLLVSAQRQSLEKVASSSMFRGP